MAAEIGHRRQVDRRDERQELLIERRCLRCRRRRENVIDLDPHRIAARGVFSGELAQVVLDRVFVGAHPHASVRAVLKAVDRYGERVQTGVDDVRGIRPGVSFVPLVKSATWCPGVFAIRMNSMRSGWRAISPKTLSRIERGRSEIWSTTVDRRRAPIIVGRRPFIECGSPPQDTSGSAGCSPSRFRWRPRRAARAVADRADRTGADRGDPAARSVGHDDGAQRADLDASR
jgi:hypothetical protein